MKLIGWAIALAAAGLPAPAAAQAPAGRAHRGGASPAAPLAGRAPPTPADAAAAEPSPAAAASTPTAPTPGIGQPDGRKGIQEQVTADRPARRLASTTWSCCR